LVHFFWHLGDAHGRRSHDAMMGDQSLFTSAAQVEQLWEISAPLLKHPPPVEPYPRGSWSSSSVDTMIAPHRWHLTRSIEVARRHPGTG
jgi:glucose-6-phosphate 1-dehydrogenase